MHCKACSFDGAAPIFRAREMMFGTKEEFSYETCPDCGTIQIQAVPEDLDRFYPDNYYSLNSDTRIPKSSSVRKIVSQALLVTPFARTLTRPLRMSYPFLFWSAIAGKTTRASCLDVGCGSGRLLKRMRKAGFTKLLGVDPYAPDNLSADGFEIRRVGIENVAGTFDLIVMSHVLEHLRNPIETLITARSLLSPGGVLIVRVPVAGSELCKQFGPDWFNLDVPRHLFIPSVDGMTKAARQAGFRIFETVFDSMEDSFLVSQGYRDGVPMVSRPETDRRRRNWFRRKAEALNSAGKGDLASYFLRVV